MCGSMVDEYIPAELLQLPENSTALIQEKTRYVYSVRFAFLCIHFERSLAKLLNFFEKFDTFIRVFASTDGSKVR